MRTLTKVVQGMPATDGAGVKLKRIIGTAALDMVDPFLMLDEFGSDDPDSWIAGFPDHPHRGFETVTVLLEGRVRHADSVGNSGVIEAGDVQWMTAGKGIIHSEMPERADGRLRGFQLWVNLPAHLKMVAPRYQDTRAARIPTVTQTGVTLRVITGEVFGVQGPVESLIPVRLLQARFEPHAALDLPVPADHNCFAYVQEGAVSSDGRELSTGQLGVYGGRGNVQLRATDRGAGILICNAMPINEPVARYGPFVMNTRDELARAFDEYQRGVLTT